MTPAQDSRGIRVLALAVTGLAGVALALSACGSSGSGGAQSTPPSTSQPSSEASSPGDSSAGTSSDAEDGSLDSLLISASDVGSGFTATPSSDEKSPLPCTPNDKPLEEQFPPDHEAQASFVNSGRTYQVTQSVQSFDDEDTADALISATQAGFACKTGTLRGASITIVPVQTGTVQGLDVLKRWDAAVPSQNALATIVLLQKGSTAELVTFFAARSQSKSIDIGGANEAAIQKLLTGAK